jgi:nucleoside-triphosphate--adenylate kinase
MFRTQKTPLSLVINIDVPDSVILSRISDRWVHLPSGRVYNMSYNRPKVDGHDDITGEPLTKRPDDNPVCLRLNSFKSLAHVTAGNLCAPTGDFLRLYVALAQLLQDEWPREDGNAARHDFGRDLASSGYDCAVIVPYVEGADGIQGRASEA